jgi:hypothetical protein
MKLLNYELVVLIVVRNNYEQLLRLYLYIYTIIMLIWSCMDETCAHHSSMLLSDADYTVTEGWTCN